MGIFDIFFRKKEKASEKVSMESLEEAAKKKIAEHNENFRQEAVNFLSRVKHQQEKIRASLKRLSSEEAKGNVDPQLLAVARTSRKSFVKKFETLTEEVEQDDLSISSVAEIFERLNKTLEDVNASTVRDFASTKEIFGKEAFAVTDEMKSLKKIYDDFEEKLKKAKDSVHPYDEMANKARILNQEKEKMKSYKKDLESVTQRNENLMKENEIMQSSLQKLEESEEWKEYLQMKRNLEQKENEKTEVISQVVQKFSSVERPLKKLNNLLKKNGSEINMKLLEKYIASPFDAFLEDYEKKTINSALQEAVKCIEQNKIDEKKSLEKIKEMIAMNVFNGLDEKWHEISNEMAELSGKIENSDVAKKKEEILKIIAGRESEIRQGGREKIEEQMKNLEQDFTAHKDELQQMAKENLSIEVECNI